MISYDSDDSRRSPGLEPIRFRYTPTPSPDTSHPNPDSPPGRRKLKKKHKPSQGDVVLLNFLAPNQPEIAHAAGQRALISDEEGGDCTTDSQSVMSNEHGTVADLTAQSSSRKDLPAVVGADRNLHSSYSSASSSSAANMATTAAAASSHPHHQLPQGHLSSLSVGRSPPDRALYGVPNPQDPLGVATQPRPQPMTLPPVRELLDAADEQGPQPSRGHHHRGSLSSTATSPYGQSPPQSFHYPPHQGYAGPSPASSGASDYAMGRHHPHPHPPGPYQPYDDRSQAGSSSQGRSPYSLPPPPGSSAASAVSVHTPGAANDPYYKSTVMNSQEYPDGADHSKRSTISPPLPGVNSIQGYKCGYPGCTAAPFQTQYLLNSHANVHSQNRPHFCSVAGCPRSEGGKGFKRKNEMIRHGLVHSSPGYVCPYCPDREHRYPRPDNLQRHVKMHHGDKPKDDPQLRDVLAQRVEGTNSNSSRGRRRRGT